MGVECSKLKSSLTNAIRYTIRVCAAGGITGAEITSGINGWGMGGEKREQLSEQLLSLRDFVRWGITQFQRAGVFYGHGTDNAFDEALSLVLYCLNLDHEH